MAQLGENAGNFADVEAGAEVHTVYGWGVLREKCCIANLNKCTVDLDWGNDNSRNKPVLYCQYRDIKWHMKAPVGSVILSKYGVGVIIDFRRVDMMYVVRLWSLRDANTAFMTDADIIKRVSGAVGWEVMSPYGRAVISHCDYSTDRYTIQLEWGTAYGLAGSSLVCWDARALPAARAVLGALHPALDRFRENLKSFAKIVTKFTGLQTGSSSIGSGNSLDVLESSLSSVMDIFKSGDVKETVRLNVEMQRENLLHSLTHAQERLVQLMQEADVRALHDSSRQALVQAANTKFAADTAAAANTSTADLLSTQVQEQTKQVYEHLKAQVDTALAQLYEVDLVAALDSVVTKSATSSSAGIADGQKQGQAQPQTHVSVQELIKSVSDVAASAAEQTQNEMNVLLLDPQTRATLSELGQHINTSYASLLKELSSAQKQLSDAVLESKSGSKLMSGGLKLRDRVTGLLSPSTTPSPAPGAQSPQLNYSAVLNVLNRKLTAETSVRAMSTLRDKLVQTVSTSEYANHLMLTATHSASARVTSMLTEWYERVFSSSQDGGLSMLAGKKLLEEFLEAYTQGSRGGLSLSYLLSRSGFFAAIEERVVSLCVSAALTATYFSGRSVGTGLKVFEAQYQQLFGGASISSASIASRLMGLQLTGLYTFAPSQLSGSYPSGYHIRRILTHPFEFAALAQKRLANTASELAQTSVGQLQVYTQTAAQQSQSQPAMLELFTALQPILETMKQTLTVTAAPPASGGADKASLLSTLSPTPSHADVTANLLKASLNTDTATDMAASILEVGEKMVDRLEAFRNMDQVQTMLSMTQSDAQASLLLSTIEQVDADAALSLATNALTDLEARKRLIDTFQSKVIDFLSAYIPTLSVPSVGGVRDEVEYYIAGLNMSGFRLNKDGISVRMASNVDASELFGFRATDINAKFCGIQWSFSQTFFPHLSGSGLAEATVEGASIDLSFRIARVPRGVASVCVSSDLDAVSKLNVLTQRFPTLLAAFDAYKGSNNSHTHAHSKSTTDMASPPPGVDTHGQAQGSSGPSVWGSHADADEEGWEPVLIISSKQINIESLKLSVENTSFAWLVNMLANIFGDIIKQYVCVQLAHSLLTGSSTLLGQVNAVVGEHWGTISGVLGLNAHATRLARASVEDIYSLCGCVCINGQVVGVTNADGTVATGTDSPVKLSKEHVFKFVEDTPIGLKLDIQKTAGVTMFHANSDKLLVAAIIPESQAHRLINKMGIDAPCFENSLIRSVNGKSLQGMTADAQLALLKGPRPLHVGIRMSDVGFNRYQSGKRDQQAQKQSKSLQSNLQQASSGTTGSAGNAPSPKRRRLPVVCVAFHEGSLGLRLRESKSCGGATIVSGYAKGPNGETLQAEAAGGLHSGMIMLSVHESCVFGIPFNDTMNIIKVCKRPMKILFTESPDSQVVFDTFPEDLMLQQVEGNIMVVTACKVSAYNADLAAGADVAAVEGDRRIREIKPGAIIIQVNRDKIDASVSVEQVLEKIRSGLPGVKVAIRDMDAFIHLIRLRDGQESLSTDVQVVN